MPAHTPHPLRAITAFPALLDYLRDELDWPIEDVAIQDLTYDYAPEELGIEPRHAAKIEAIKQLRPLASAQPWGIFYIQFEAKRLPIVVMRRILSGLAPSAHGRQPDRPAWRLENLLFISVFGDPAAGERQIAFAHFQQQPGDLPTLRVLGWDGADTPLKLEHVAATLREGLRWPADPADADAWGERWAGAFRHRQGHVIRTADALAERLAALARGIRDAARTLMAIETEQGPLRRLHRAFQAALIHDLTQDDFADTYAQTITYGLLAAAISRTDMAAGRHGTALVAQNVADMATLANPFLKEMLGAFLQAGGRPGGIAFDELGVQDVVELLRGDETDLPAILRDFGNKTRGEDPVIHFYEHFLAAYDKALKVKRGIFYTPQPVVSYIVRSVHELLQTEFGLEDGLAATATWAEMAARQPELVIPEGTDPASPFVVVLDPAAGTATFLVEAIEVIHRTLRAKWQAQGLSAAQQRAAWNAYVPRHLLPRLFGYELMMAPYAIAHMKIALKLAETGFDAWDALAPADRVRVYLTNALEPAAAPGAQQLAFADWAPALAHEALAVNAVKRDQRFTVVIGNPPYSNFSANMGVEERKLVSRYKQIDGQPLRERNALQLERNLNDDYVKYVALGDEVMGRSLLGILGMITNNSLLTAKTLRGVRARMLLACESLYITDLGGGTDLSGGKKDNSLDDNVFDITQGVATTLLVRSAVESIRNETISFCRISGSRDEKYTILSTNSVSSVCKPHVPTKHPYWAFGSSVDAVEWDDYIAVDELLTIYSEGLKTGFDDGLIAFSMAECRDKVNSLADTKVSADLLRKDYGIGDRGWASELLRNRTRTAESALESRDIVRFPYRPMDFRYVVWPSKLLKASSLVVGRHMVGDKAVCLVLAGQISGTPYISHFYVSRRIPDNRIFYSTKGSASFFPLYYVKDGLFDTGGATCISESARDSICSPLGLRWLNQGCGDLIHSMGPESLVRYCYAVFHSVVYRERYRDSLMLGFPRIPTISSLPLFRALAALGGELVALHLMESPALDAFITTYVGPAAPRVEKVSYAEGAVWLDKAQTAGFRGVPEAVWQFHIGGYQVCDKWLKDRGPKKGQPGRVLAAEDIAHYQRIVVALSETLRLMGAIDAAIEAHGGWPIR